jgi:nicotinate-nucleotide adenylyltransferase
MLQLAIDDLELRNTSVHPELSDRYTLNTVNKARSNWGENTEFNLVIGSDILPQITSWYRIKELLEQVKVLIVPRLGYEINQVDLTRLNCLGGEYTIANLNVAKASSSAYRTQQDRSLVPSSVKDYIDRWNLYGSKK